MSSSNSWMKRVVAPLALATLASCGGSVSTPDANDPGTKDPARTALPRDLTSAERDVLSASNKFSFSLWNTINQTQRDSNVFVSPLSASFALGLMLNGASNTTYT